MPKLVKNSNILPYHPRKDKLKRGVRGAFRKALAKAEAQGWTRVVISGQGIDEGHTCWSPMRAESALGMCDIAKHVIIRDMLE